MLKLVDYSVESLIIPEEILRNYKKSFILYYK